MSGQDGKSRHHHHGGGNLVYGLGLVGAMVFYIQQAHGFWPGVLGILKAFVWPAFLIYDVLQFLAR